jgi:hypothetical protein
MQLKQSIQKIFEDIEENLSTHSFDAIDNNVRKLSEVLDLNKQVLSRETVIVILAKIENLLSRVGFIRNQVKENLAKIQKTLKAIDRYEE